MKPYDVDIQDRRRNLKARVSLLYVLGEMDGYQTKIRCQDTYEPVADFLGLTRAEKNVAIKGKSGKAEDEPWQPNLVRWARYDLQQMSLFASSNRGYWQLNERGQQMYMQLKENFEASGKTFETYIEDIVNDRRTGQAL